VDRQVLCQFIRGGRPICLIGACALALLFAGCNKQTSPSKTPRPEHLVVTYRAPNFNAEDLDDSMGWLAKTVLKYETAKSSDRIDVQREMLDAFRRVSGKRVKWTLNADAPHFCLGGRYVLPIADDYYQCHHFLYISVAARDRRPAVKPNPFWDPEHRWDGQVVELLPDVDLPTDDLERIKRGPGGGINVSARIESILYVPGPPSFIKLYLEDCVPEIRNREPGVGHKL
jgi:hypothetical protein